MLDDGVFPGAEDVRVALTTVTKLAVDAFIDGAMVTTPIVVVTTVEADKEFEVVTVARDAIAPELLVAFPDVLEEVVAPDVVDLITGATTAVTTVAVVLEVLDPNPLTELDDVLPTAATSEVDVFIAEDSELAKDLDKFTVEDTTVLVELSDGLETAVVTAEEPEIVSTPEVFELVDEGLVIPYGLGAKQHIICALDEDLVPLKPTSSCLSIATRTAEVFDEVGIESDVSGTLAVDSPSWTAGVSFSTGSAGTTPSNLSAAGWIISATSV